MARHLRTTLISQLTCAKLLDTHHSAQLDRPYRREILRFDQGKLFQISDLHQTLVSQEYQHSPYNHFYINDPKPRHIMSLPFNVRVVHQWLVEYFIKPYYIPRFSTQSFACIPGRGTHKAVWCAQSHLRYCLDVHAMPYIVRCDIHQFFHSIDKHKLFYIITRSIQDPSLLELLHTVIFSGVPGPGLPIGNYTSQYFANIYLNELDQYIKRQLKVKLYVRYMDDFLCFVPDKQTAKVVLRAIEQFVADKLNLQLNLNSRYFPASHGLDFCGYRIYRSHKKLRNRSKRKLCQIIDDFESGLDNEDRFHQRANAWLGHAMHADSFRYAHKKLGTHAASFAQLTPKDTKNNP